MPHLNGTAKKRAFPAFYSVAFQSGFTLFVRCCCIGILYHNYRWKSRGFAELGEFVIPS